MFPSDFSHLPGNGRHVDVTRCRLPFVPSVSLADA